jgi:putative oxidoreductase
MDWNLLFSTTDDWMIAFLRIVLGVIIFPHGAQKVLGWFNGDGIKGTLHHMKQVGVPSLIAWLTIIGQFLGSIALILGFCTRFAAVGIFIIMGGAMVINLPNGWLMNWTGQKKGEGIEYFILLLAITFFIIIKGSGPAAIDDFITF